MKMTRTRKSRGCIISHVYRFHLQAFTVKYMRVPALKECIIPSGLLNISLNLIFLQLSLKLRYTNSVSQ